MPKLKTTAYFSGKRRGRAFRRNRNRSFINSQKNKPCELCGVQYHPWQMQFDHLDPSIKRFNVSRYTTKSIDRLREEISRCRLLCSNCHADETYKQKHANGSKFSNPRSEVADVLKVNQLTFL